MMISTMLWPLPGTSFMLRATEVKKSRIAAITMNIVSIEFVTESGPM